MKKENKKKKNYMMEKVEKKESGECKNDRVEEKKKNA